MEKERHFFLAVISVVLLIIIPACVGLQYGKIRLRPGGPERVTIEKLQEKWQDYTVYYTGLSLEKPSALLFDPKDDDKLLTTHKYWDEVKENIEASCQTDRVNYKIYFHHRENKKDIKAIKKQREEIIREKIRTQTDAEIKKRTVELQEKIKEGGIVAKVLEAEFLTDRDKKILKLRLSGKTYQEIGDFFGVTRERVRQIGDKIKRKLSKNLTSQELKDYTQQIRARKILNRVDSAKRPLPKLKHLKKLA